MTETTTAAATTTTTTHNLLNHPPAYEDTNELLLSGAEVAAGVHSPTPTSYDGQPPCDYSAAFVPAVDASDLTTTLDSASWGHASVPYINYNFEAFAGGRPLELARCQWLNYGDQHYLRGCLWSPDGTCLLAVIRGAGMQIFELPPDCYSAEVMPASGGRLSQPLVAAVSVPEAGLIYDQCWYPGMNSSLPATCCWLSSGHEGPIHLWDAFSGCLRCSYRGYNSVDELEAALSVTFSADGQSIFCGYKKDVKIFSTARPGRDYVEYAIAYPASCLVASQAQPGVVAVGSRKSTIDLVSQSDGTFRHLCKLTGHKGGITTMAFSQDGCRLYSGARKDKELVCWDLRVPGRPLFCLQRESHQTNQKITLDVSKCGNWLVSGGTDGKVQAWNVRETSYPSTQIHLALYKDSCNGVSLHPYRPILATCSGQHQKDDPINHTRHPVTYENALSMWWVGLQGHPDDYLP